MTDDLFNKALGFVLKSEGGFSDDPADKGGETNHGITETTYNAWLKSKGQPSKDVKNITPAEVSQIYYQNYWLAAGCDKMAKVFAVYAFDTAVNMGVGRVQEFMQAAQYKDSAKFIEARNAKYEEFVKDDPTQARFLRGWLNRTAALVTFAKTV